MNRTLKKINPNSHNIQMTGFKLLYFGHIMPKSSSLEKALILGKGKRRGQPEAKQMDLVIVVMDAQFEDQIIGLGEIIRDKNCLYGC